MRVRENDIYEDSWRWQHGRRIGSNRSRDHLACSVSIKRRGIKEASRIGKTIPHTLFFIHVIGHDAIAYDVQIARHIFGKPVFQQREGMDILAVKE